VYLPGEAKFVGRSACVRASRSADCATSVMSFQVDQRLAALEGPGQPQATVLERGAKPLGQHVIGRLENRELQTRGQQMLLDVPFDLVLLQIGGDRMKDRGEDEVAGADGMRECSPSWQISTEPPSSPRPRAWVSRR